MTKLMIIALFLVFSLNIVSAYDVVYVVSDTNKAKPLLMNTLQDSGFNVLVAKISDINSIDFSAYDFMLINDDQFQNYNSIPVNSFPALIINKNYMDEWHWTSYISQKSASQPLKAHINDPANFITYGFSGDVQVYTSSSSGGIAAPLYYLHRWVKAPRLKTIVSTDDATIYNTNNAVIATAVPGTTLKDGFVSSTKSVFFGITESDIWTSTTQQLFINSALWLVTDTTPPVISSIAVTDITNTSAVISWYTDDNSNSTVSFGTTEFIGDIWEKNYTREHVINLVGLMEKTSYYYQIASCNSDSYCSETEILSFTTKDLTAPNSLAASITNITNSSVNISVTTDEPAYSSVYYGSSLAQRTVTSSLSSSTSFYIGSLQEKTSYAFLVEVCDENLNCKNSSVYEFTTLDFTPPSQPRNLILEVINPSSIRLNWDVPLGEEVAEYLIYASLTPYDFDFQNPVASTTLTEYTDSAASLAKQRYYIVRSEDAAQNEEENVNIVGKFDLDLHIGYNLVAFPLTPLSADIGSVMHEDATYSPVSEIRRYNTDTQEFDIVAYTAGGWQPSNFDELSPLEGYFFKSSEDTRFTIVGYPYPQTLSIREGLNLVGLTLFDDKEIGDVVMQSPSDYNVTYIASRNGSIYDIASYYPSQDSWFVSDFDINPGVGYWIKANKDFTLSLK